VHQIHNFAVRWRSNDLNVLDRLQVGAEVSQIFPLGVVEFQKLLLFDQLVEELLEVLGLTWVLIFDHLDESSLELLGSPLDMFQGIAGILADSHLMTG